MESDSDDYDAGALKQYVRQKEKPKLFSLFKNPFSRKPVIYDTLQARLTCQDLVKAMQNQGFMHAGVSLNTTTEGKKLDAKYILYPGIPYVMGKVEYDVEDENIQNILHLDDPDNQNLKPGMRFSVEALDNERKRIANLLMDDGYFRFNKDFIYFSADTIAGQNDIALTLHLTKYKASSNAPETDHPRYQIRNINYLSNDSDRIHLRRQVLLNATALKEGRPYSASALQRTYNNFARLQAVKYTNIRFAEVGRRNTFSFVSHHDESSVFERLLIDVVTVQQGSVYGNIIWKRFYQTQQIAIFYLYSCNAAHRSLHHLRVVYIGSILTAIDMGDAKPVGNADDGTQVAWVLYAIKSQIQFIGVDAVIS